MREILDHFEKERQLHGNCSERLREYCCFGDEEGVRKVLELSNVDINSQNKVNGWTALHWAAKRGYVGICVLLLKHGADPEITNASNQIPSQLTNDINLQNLLSPSPPPCLSETEETDDLSPRINSCVNANGEEYSPLDGTTVFEDIRQCKEDISDNHNISSGSKVAKSKSGNADERTPSFNKVVSEQSVAPPSASLSTLSSNGATGVQSLSPCHIERYTSPGSVDSSSPTEERRQNSWPANDNPGFSGNSGYSSIWSNCPRDCGSTDIGASFVANGTTEVKKEAAPKNNLNPISFLDSPVQLESASVVQDQNCQRSFPSCCNSALALSNSQWSPTGVNNSCNTCTGNNTNITSESAGVCSNLVEESKDKEWTRDKQSPPPGPLISERSDKISSGGVTNCANYVICTSSEEHHIAVEANTQDVDGDITTATITSQQQQQDQQEGTSSYRHHYYSGSASDRLSNCQSLPEGEESATNKDQRQGESKMPQPSINLVPSYMSRVRPPTTGSLSSYNEDFTYPWKKLPQTPKTVQHSHSMPSTPPNNSGGKSNDSTSQQSPLVQNNSNQASIYNTTASASNYLGVIKNGGTNAIHDLNPSPVASGSGIFSSNESMPIAVAETHSAVSNMEPPLPVIISSGGRILKVRVSDQCDKDFVEIDLPVSKLSIQGFLEISCHELGLEYPVHIERIRKLPNTRLRRDVEVQRLANYQELELVLSKYPPAPINTQPPSALNSYPLKTTSSRSSTDLMM